MSYTKKNLNLNKEHKIINNVIYKAFTIADLPSYFEKIPMQATFNSKGLTYINIDCLKKS